MSTHSPTSPDPLEGFAPDESFARQLDAADPLAGYRERFHIPTKPDGQPLIYFCGNSLGLQPRSVRAGIERELDHWARLGVDGHFQGKTPWYSHHEMFRESGARLVGAKPDEVVMMNSLTINLHLMLMTFYRPTDRRHKILMEYPVFPSDTYAIKTQLAFHGFDPAEALIEVKPQPGEHVLSTEALLAAIEEHGDRIALVMLAGVNFFTGQWLDMQAITTAAGQRGCVVGWDLAHAVGNVPLTLHDWGVDFAVWCHYKYLNSGPGAVGGCFVHERHAHDTTLPRLGGWWGNDPSTRFRMHLQPEFVPRTGAAGWQVSNPPILSLVPIKNSLDLFDEIGMDALREKSRRLTGYLYYLMDRLSPERFEIITPRDPQQRGCQLSMLVKDKPKALFDALKKAGIVGDFREPDVIRIAPVPLYNRFHEVWAFAQILEQHTTTP